MLIVGVEPVEEPAVTVLREVRVEADVLGQLRRCLGVFEMSKSKNIDFKPLLNFFIFCSLK